MGNDHPLKAESMRLRTLLAATFTYTLCLGPVIASEPIQWSDPANNGRNNVIDTRGLPAELGEGNLLWQVDHRGRWQFAQPLVAGRRLLLGAHVSAIQDEAIKRANPSKHAAAVICLDRSTGDLLWELAVTPGPGLAYGVATQGVVEGSLYYIHTGTNVLCLDIHGQTDGNDGPYTDELKFMTKGGRPPDAVRAGRSAESLEEIKPQYGDIVWHCDLSQLGVRPHDSGAGTPLLDGDLLWVNTSHAMGVEPAPAWHKEEHGWDYTPVPNIVALDKTTGRIVATDDLQIPRVFHGQWSSPSMGIVDGRKLLFWGDGYGVLHAFAMPEDLSGEGNGVDVLEEIWRFDANLPEYRFDELGEIPYPGHGTGRKEDVRGVVIGPQDIIAAPVFHKGNVYVAIGRDRVYNAQSRGRVVGPGAISCIDPRGSGDITETNVIWQSTDIGRTQSTPSIENGLLYIADMAGYLHCFDAETGLKHWQYDLDQRVETRSQLVADGKIYVANERHELFVLTADEQPPRLLSTYRTRGLPTTPTAADGVLYVADSRGIMAFAGPGHPGSSGTVADMSPY
jgi:outer membrane protein assembly factor BamB